MDDEGEVGDHDNHNNNEDHVNHNNDEDHVNDDERCFYVDFVS